MTEPYGVLIVDDEPAAARYLKSIVEGRCPGFRVAGTADNGCAALEQAAALRPAAVLTDVRMPVMDGIALAHRMKETFPDIPLVIISGYAEFEYARGALATGAVEYLLKPVSPKLLQGVMERLRAELDGRREAGTAAFLCRAAGSRVSDAEGEDGAPYRAALLREGGLPSRNRLSAAGDSAVALDRGFFALGGRDDCETLYLASCGAWSFGAFSDRLAALLQDGECATRTLVIREEPVHPSGLHEAVVELRRALDAQIVPGEARVRRCEYVPAEIPRDGPLEDRIAYAVREGRADRLEAAVRDACGLWQSSSRPLASAAAAFRVLLGVMARNAAKPGKWAEVERLLEDALSEAEDYPTLAADLCAAAEAASGLCDRDRCAQDVPAFFADIRRWVESRYGENLSLAAVSRQFRISPSYLTKLFRKYADAGFCDFLARVRIEAAKRLIAEEPGIPLKEVAERVGYGDPFYFSRVFKTVTGLPPSEYLRGIRGK